MQIDELIKQALVEDIGGGDITSLACIPADNVTEYHMNTRENIRLCGIEIAARTFEINGVNEVEILTNDGADVAAGGKLLRIKGNARNILSAERVALNFVQYLSGISTKCREYAELVKALDVKILDTRKTLPLYRDLAKYAVRIGGCHNHRMGLYDAVLIKDNHIIAAGGVAKAVESCKNYLGAEASRPTSLEPVSTEIQENFRETTIQVECDTIAQVEQAFHAGANSLLLDNMSLEQLQEIVVKYKGKIWLEASGGITLQTIRNVAETGVDAISIGSLTHSVKAVDVGLD
jgi:nicotinate-nucleotide pyrophosphorylase (carboxylating)